MSWLRPVVLLLATLVEACRGVYLETFQTGVWKVKEDTFYNLTLSLRFNVSDAPSVWEQGLEEARLVVTVVPDQEGKLDFVNPNVFFTAEEVLAEVNKTLTFSGYYWGITHLSFYLTQNDLDPDFNTTLLRDDLAITVDRMALTLDIVFISVGSVFVLFNNANMGAQLNLEIIKSVLKRPVGPLCGFLSQFAVMPMASFWMGHLLFTDPLQRLGLFTLGCSPGGTSSNFWTLMFNGDINLSITMTAISTIAAMGMMPLWMFTMGKQLLQENADLQIPFGNMAVSLASLTIPVCIGILIRIKRPIWADKGAKIIKPFSFFILLFFMIMGTYNSYKVVLMMTWQMAVAGLMVAASGYSLGAVFARVMCLSKPQIIAVSIETALQNPGVAFILLKLSIESPYSDLAAVPIVATLMVTGPPLILTFSVYACLRRFCGCCPDDSENLKVEGEAAKSLRELTEGADDDDDVFEVISDVQKQRDKD
ncbi:ileal sodium/bile acid cotransporter-like [Panulirus ornatus]|uniref:ileal sodium/bile acid cotransporter-like n=1 Tax=Panulirus ornatus TaxID=150431 RepID=UPI003A8C090A